jgi:sigma-E factor negative regulatory protein RseC
MTQVALVKKILSGGAAEVSVHRKSACGHDCSSCGGCELTITKSDILVTAENGPGARPGDVVLVESANGTIIYTAIMVYLVPFILFFIGYFFGKALLQNEGFSILIAFVGFAVGFLPARRLDKRVKKDHPVQFRIVEITKPCSDI